MRWREPSVKRGRGKGVQAQERQRKSPFIIHAGGIIITAVAFEINNRLRLGKLYVKIKIKKTGGAGGEEPPQKRSA